MPRFSDVFKIARVWVQGSGRHTSILDIPGTKELHKELHMADAELGRVTCWSVMPMRPRSEPWWSGLHGLGCW